MLHIDIIYPRVNNLEIVIASGSNPALQKEVSEAFVKKITASKQVNVTAKVIDQVFGSVQTICIKWKRLPGDPRWYFSSVGALLCETAVNQGFKLESDTAILDNLWRFRFLIFSKSNNV